MPMDDVALSQNMQMAVEGQTFEHFKFTRTISCFLKVEDQMYSVPKLRWSIRYTLHKHVLRRKRAD